MERYLKKQILNDLKKKMVFVGGPRQVGKTTVSKSLPNAKSGYMNWDDDEDRERILRREFPTGPLWIFDEIHKFKRWRNFMKGLFDKNRDEKQILVTGSARLDLYRFGGDSLQGRYHFLRMHPLSVAELKISSLADFQILLKLGGFPEPFFHQSEIESKRWSREYRIRLIREDITKLETIQDLDSLELLSIRLPALVGSPLSVNALREDLQVSFKTAARWISIFENVYSIFMLPPFGSPLIRAVKKERKHYHFDWALVTNEGLRFENLVACHLLKWVHYLEDTEGRDIELRYFRDLDQREVDFVVVDAGKPILAVECKFNDAEVSSALRYFKNKFPKCESWQVHAVGKKDYVNDDGISVGPALKLLGRLV